MKLIKNLFMSVAACGLIAGSALAAVGSSASDTGTAGASIICALSIENVTVIGTGSDEGFFEQDLEFGQIILGAGQMGGNVTVGCDGSWSQDSMLSLEVEPAFEAINPHPAQFNASANALEEIHLVVAGTPGGTGAITLTRVGFADTMTVDTLTVCNSCGEGQGGNYNEEVPGEWEGSASGNNESNGCVCVGFFLGGTLHVNNSQPSGRYLGTFTATIYYS